MLSNEQGVNNEYTEAACLLTLVIADFLGLLWPAIINNNHDF